jgi:4-alpha-glucanotransferase
MFERTSGVLMHITSLPSPHGIGSLGKAAYDFVDFLQAAGQRYWQVLPLGHTGFGDSPYQCFSAAAGNYLMIDLDMLEQDGLLTKEEIQQAEFNHSPDKVEYELLAASRPPLLRKAFARVDDEMQLEITAFRRRNRSWIEDYTLFMALKEEKFEGRALWDWTDEEVRSRVPAAMKAAREELKEEMDFRVFLQYLFFKQWDALHEYANAHGVQIIGDIPIYVSPDSADVWQHPTLFKVGSDFKPKKVAGVPPDYYSETGQLWGNPVYDWKIHEEENYKWWIWRIKSNLALFDVIRIDHFRGLESYWEVSAKAENAIKGRWCKGPGMKLFHALEAELGKLPIVAEDLGIITDKVRELLEESGFPGMKVLIFGFDVWNDNEHLPHNYKPNMIVYTSTHDSQSICEQIMDICNDAEKEFAYQYLRTSHQEAMGWSAIKTVWASPANITMTTMQDILSLGADARMNVPSTLGGNWAWRVRKEGINEKVAKMLCEITKTYKRYKPYQPPVKHSRKPVEKSTAAQQEKIKEQPETES